MTNDKFEEAMALSTKINKISRVLSAIRNDQINISFGSMNVLTSKKNSEQVVKIKKIILDHYEKIYDDYQKKFMEL